MGEALKLCARAADDATRTAAAVADESLCRAARMLVEGGRAGEERLTHELQHARTTMTAEVLRSARTHAGGAASAAVVARWGGLWQRMDATDNASLQRCVQAVKRLDAWQREALAALPSLVHDLASDAKPELKRRWQAGATNVGKALHRASSRLHEIFSESEGVEGLAPANLRRCQAIAN